jgi:hypothetical protein
MTPTRAHSTRGPTAPPARSSATSATPDLSLSSSFSRRPRGNPRERWGKEAPNHGYIQGGEKPVGSSWCLVVARIRGKLQPRGPSAADCRPGVYYARSTMTIRVHLSAHDMGKRGVAQAWPADSEPHLSPREDQAACRIKARAENGPSGLVVHVRDKVSWFEGVLAPNRFPFLFFLLFQVQIPLKFKLPN